MRAFYFKNLSLLGLIFLISCREAIVGSDGSINNGNGEDPPVGEVDDVAGFYMRVYDADDSKYYMHQAGSDFSKECVVATDETDIAKRDIICIVDMPEEDLHYQGVKLQYNVPTTMCEYATYMPYYFENYQIGFGPSNLYYDKDQHGNIGVDANNDGTISGAGEAQADFTVSGLNGSEPRCEYDFSESEGPNCCLGSYIITGRDWNTTSSSYAPRETELGEWGGEAGECLYGPAIETQPLTSDGWPMADIDYVKGIGLNRVYKPSTPLEKLAGTVYLANYFDPTDHTSTEFSGFPGGLNRTSRYYELRCLNRAHELKARIRVQIREWNEYSEWELGSAGDPDTTDSEPEFPDFEYNDYLDWANYFFGGVEFFPHFEKN